MTWTEIDAYNASAEAEGRTPIRVLPIYEDAEPDLQEA